MPYAAEILLPLAQNLSLFVVFAVAFAGVGTTVTVRLPWKDGIYMPTERKQVRRTASQARA